MKLLYFLAPVLIIVLLLGITFTLLKNSEIQVPATSPGPTVLQSTPLPSLSPSPSPSPSPKPLTAKKILDVAFLVQAPHANWDPLHEEACEEASLLNVLYFLQGRKPVDMHAGESDIQALVKYQEEIGYGVSITLEQLAKVAKDKYGLQGHVEKNATIEKIKHEIDAGKPVIVGAAGKILPNPFFKNGGPVYHMLVIKGYDDTKTVDKSKCRNIDSDSCPNTPGVFITNDVGIRQGDNFLYSYQGLYKAIHDWNEQNILEGEKRYLTFTL